MENFRDRANGGVGACPKIIVSTRSMRSQSHSLQLQESLLEPEPDAHSGNVLRARETSRPANAALVLCIALDATVFIALAVACLVWPEWSVSSISGDSRQAVSASAVYATRSAGVLAAAVSLLCGIAAIASSRDELLMPVAVAAVISLVGTGNILLDVVHEGGVTIWSSAAMCVHAGTSIGLLVLNMLGLISVIVRLIRSPSKTKARPEPDRADRAMPREGDSTLPPGRRRLLSVRGYIRSSRTVRIVRSRTDLSACPPLG